MLTSVQSKVAIQQATEEDINYVTENIRDIDWREISPLLWISEKEELAKTTWKQCGQSAWVAVNGHGERVAVFGGNMILPGVASIWLWATDKINRRVWLAITKWGVAALDRVFEQGLVHRAQAMVADFNYDARKWIAKCGMTLEVEFLASGKNQEDYIIMSRFIEKEGE